jgi:hypothetical protein
MEPAEPDLKFSWDEVEYGLGGRPLPGAALQPFVLWLFDSAQLSKRHVLHTWHASRHAAGHGRCIVPRTTSTARQPFTRLTGKIFTAAPTKKPRDLSGAGFSVFGLFLRHRCTPRPSRLFGGSNLGGLPVRHRTEIRAYKLGICGQTMTHWQGFSLRSS